MRKSGIIITLIGIGLSLISIFASEGFHERRSIMGNIYSMEVVLDHGRLVTDERPLYSMPPVPKIEEKEEKKEPGMVRNPLYGIPLPPYVPPKIEGRKSIPLTSLLSLSTIITLVGVGTILLSKNKNKTA